MAKGARRAPDTDMVFEHIRSAAIAHAVLTDTHVTPFSPLSEGATFRTTLPQKLSYDEVEGDGMRVTVGVVIFFPTARLGRCDQKLIKRLVVTLRWLPTGNADVPDWILQNSVEVEPYDKEKHRFLPKIAEVM